MLAHQTQGHFFTHETESPCPFTLPQALSLVGKAEPVQVRFTLCLRDRWSYVNVRWMSSFLHGFLHGIEWVMFHGHLDCFLELSLGGRFNIKLRDHGILNAHNRWFILFYQVWGPTWIDIHWNSIWLRVRTHITSHDTWGPMITLHDFGGVLGQPLDTFFWAPTISWSWLLACVCSGPQYHNFGARGDFWA